MSQTVIGIFDNASEAQNAVQHLLSNGFTRESIDISARSGDDTVAGSSDTYYNTNRNDNDNVGDKISSFFSNLFGADDNYSGYSEVARRGSIVTVHARSADEAERAALVLDQYGAVDIDERASQYRNNFTNTDTTSTTSAADITTNSIPVIEEQLNVGKRVVETGGVRLRSRIVERPIEESLRLREERVFVERNPVNRPATSADLNTFQDGVIEMREQTEVPVVAKEARVVEEINLSKEVEEREETIRDTVRRTDVEVENLHTDENRRTDLDDDDLTLNRPGAL